MTMGMCWFLIAVPLCVFFATAVITRAARTTGILVSPQGACFLAGGLIGAVATAIILIWNSREHDVGLMELAAGLLYMFIFCFCVNFLNWFVFTLTETSMHVHLVVEVSQEEGIELHELQKRYNKQSIIQARIPRLIELGQLRIEGGRLYLGGSWVLRGAMMCRMLRILLNIPPRPEQER
jgi:hypothetical protein